MSSPPPIYRLFRATYVAGLLVVVGLVVLEIFSGVLSAQLGGTWTLVLLGLSLTHVIALAVLGFWMKRLTERRQLYVHGGTQVQTAGYLHTLIGFTAALLVFDTVGVGEPGQIQLRAVLFPVGSAITTSVLGWFFGGEIVGREALDDLEIAAREQLATLMNDLDGFMERSREQHAKYHDLLEAIVGLQGELRKRQEKYLEDTEVLASSVSSGLNALKKESEKIRTSLSSASSALTSSFGSEGFEASVTGIQKEVQKLHSTLSGTAVHSEHIESALERSTEHTKGIESSLESFASDAPEVHANYRDQLQEAHEVLRDVTTTIQSLLNETQEEASRLADAPELLKPVRSLLNDLGKMLGTIQQSVEEVDGSAQSVRRSLLQVNESGAETRNALEETTDTTQRMAHAIRQTRHLIDDMIKEGYYENERA